MPHQVAPQALRMSLFLSNNTSHGRLDQFAVRHLDDVVHFAGEFSTMRK